MDRIAKQLLHDYVEQNPPVIDELGQLPSPLEFMRHVARNRPFVVRRGGADISAVHKWDRDYLEKVMGDSNVQVAVTPDGRADSIRVDGTDLDIDDGMLYVQPLEQTEPFADALRYIVDHGKASDVFAGGPAKYLQTQNDNLRDEYHRLLQDVPEDISFARIALDKEPDAVNFWLGNQHSVTSLHKDNYENIYLQVRGTKKFWLWPPVVAPWVRDTSLRLARWQRSQACKTGGKLGQSDMVAVVERPVAFAPVPTIDPLESSNRGPSLTEIMEPVQVELQEGDILYLPAMWFHYVEQTCGKQGFSCSVNYWYDMEFSGHFWAVNGFLRNIELVP